MSEPKKDTIYIDIDDEITGIIEKMTASPQKIVALVLPKRAAVFQSLVNMKLLKRRADEAKKQAVLITSETNLLPLAGAAGLFVARSLQTKPEVPPPPEIGSLAEPIEADAPADGAETSDGTGKIDLKKSIGSLAGLPPKEDEEEAIELDNDEKETETKAPKAAKPKNKKLKIPNFEKFRTRFIVAGLALLLLSGLWVYAFIIAPKATITIKTDSTAVNSNLSATLDTAASALDEEKAIIPAKLNTYKKTDTQKVPATGTKDNGTKASGEVTISNCTDNEVTVPAGTGVSAAELTYITQNTISLGSGNFDSTNNCKTSGSHVETVGVVSQNNGEQYNLAARSDYKVAGFPSLSATGTQMSGGTSKIVKIVSAADIETAKQKLTAANQATATAELVSLFSKDKIMPIKETLVAGETSVRTTPNVGDEAAEVTVTSETIYTMLGVNQDDLVKLVEKDLKSQIDEERQTLLDNGLDEATFRSNEKNDKTAKVTVLTVGLAGAQLDTEAIRKQAAGKRKGAVIDGLKALPGVEDVDVTYSPFWVLAVPKKASNITVIIEQPDQIPDNTEADADSEQ